MKRVGTILLLMCLPRLASADALMENRLLFSPREIGPSSVDSIEVFHDESNDHRFWWVSSSLHIKSAPTSGLPLLRWDFNSQPARLSAVLELVPRSAVTAFAVRSLIARRYPFLNPNRIVLSALAVREIRAEFVFRSHAENSGVVPADEWLGRSALPSRDIPLSATLLPRYVALIRGSSRAMTTVQMQVHALIQAKLTAARSAASAQPACVANALTESSPESGSEEGDLSGIAGTRIPKLFLFATFAQIEGRCVFRRFASGASPSPLQEQARWMELLQRAGVIIDRGEDWEFGSLGLMNVFFSVSELYAETVIAESRADFPILLSHIPVNKMGSE